MMVETTYKLTNWYFIMDSIGIKIECQKVASSTTILGFLGRSQSLLLESHDH